MNRRELLHAAGAAACVAVVPELFTLPLLATVSSAFPGIAWNENTTSAYMLARIKPLMAKYDRAVGLHSLTPDEWDELANAHAGYFNEHSRIGSLRNLDEAIRAHQPHLAGRWNPTAVQYVAANGSYSLLSQMPAKLHQVATKLRQEPYAPATFLSCGGFMSTAAMLYGVMGFFVAIPEAEIVLLGMALLCWVMEISMC